ncbi:two-component system phosphate regulon sensor histidine kinase PhoR [Parabacteroides sp. PFB2-12]|uniref:sensor histidine kinase n=1 Tax=unclassified Parabacteroides TaxID=2649774 RepID=UPI002474544B|nr:MULTISPECIES: HAMP domain-containing sensor histidine kinase [unclassified Parabacteroides]MDH6341746.1 two-component system phosphate regulon sensor histidine kinase PhoR [Parabacteroides sp. PM6-13]MDH6389831.1 two-component system phosphate regulon sensor histidine kinase PhoR [Parabacteroides sp. PFB2-12]
MRKSTIWLVTGVMVFTFAMLLYMQVTYITDITRMRSEQFNEIVKKSLNQVSKTLEYDEGKKYLIDDMELQHSILQRSSLDTRSIEQIITQYKIRQESESGVQKIEFNAITTQKTDPLSSLSTRQQQQQSGHSIVKTSADLQREYARRYLLQLDQLQEVARDMLHTANLKPIQERVDFEQLKTYLRTEFVNNGLNIPFVFQVINKDGNPVYQSGEMQRQISASDMITMALFSKDPPSRQNYLRVYFPTKQDYIRSQVKFIIPSFIFLSILLVTFTFTLFIIFRQKKLSEMKNDFINNMTHELKTPVSTISLAAQMMKDTDITKSPEVFKHISGVIGDETKRLGFLVEKVLQMSLFEKQKASLKLKEIDANDLVAGIANTFVLKVEKYGGTLDIDLRAEESAIYADEMHITNVLFNLMDNAVKYRRQEEPLKLMARTWNDNGRLLISVEDNGIGIKKEHLKKVFDRFYRIPTGNIHDVKGFGLGLAYVRKMVEDHKGTIRAEQGSGNVGTKFIITLPLIKS